MTTQAEAIARAGAILAGGYADLNCPGGTSEELERLAAYLQRLQQEVAEHTPAA